MLRLTIVSAFIAVVGAQKETFDFHKVFRVVPKNEAQIDLLRKVAASSDKYTLWNNPTHANVSVDLMVAPQKIVEFKHAMYSTGTHYETFVDNVQKLIDAENPNSKTAVSISGFDWLRYHDLDEIYAFLDELAATYPDKVQVVVGGETYEGRQIKGVKVSFKENNPGIFIEGGIHACEWISPAVVTYVLNELLTSKDPEVRQLAESNDWYIFPIFNPDGYVYTHTTNRLWRKTRKPYGKSCYGADANRNFGYKWMGRGASSDPCSESHAGSEPFSEIEIKTISEYISSISDKIYAYINFHSYSQLLLLPYGYTKKHLDNYDELFAIGLKTIEALEKRYGTQYVTGNIAETIYYAAGTSLDWVKGTFQFPIAYSYELRDQNTYGFLLPADQIIPTCEETLDSLVGLFKEAGRRGIPKRP